MRFSIHLILGIVSGSGVIAAANVAPEAVSPEIEAWIQDLGSSKFQIRESATNRLLAAGDEVVEPLRAVLEDTDRERARRARQILMSILNEADVNSLVGKWDYITVKLDGEKLKASGQLKIDRKAMTIHKATGNDPFGAMPFTIDATQSPKHLDFEYMDFRIRCLYKLDGDSLTLCYSQDSGDARPAKISCEPGSGTRLHILRRAAK